VAFERFYLQSTSKRFNPPRCLVFAALLASASESRAGEGIFGTKTSPVSTAGGGSAMGAMPIAQMFVALLVVLAILKWLLPMALKKYSRRGAVSSDGIRVQETAALGPANLYVVEVRGKSFLVGTTASSVSCIAELSVDPVKPLPTFQEMIDAVPAKPKPSDSLEDVLGQLNRLRNLGS